MNLAEDEVEFYEEYQRVNNLLGKSENGGEMSVKSENETQKVSSVTSIEVVTLNPTFHITDEIESIDIDTEFDFMVAEYVYRSLNE